MQGVHSNQQKLHELEMQGLHARIRHLEGNMRNSYAMQVAQSNFQYRLEMSSIGSVATVIMYINVIYSDKKWQQRITLIQYHTKDVVVAEDHPPQFMGTILLALVNIM